MLIYKIPLKKEEDKEKTEKSTQNIQQTRFQLSAQSNVKEPTIEEDPKNFKKILSTQTSKFLKEQRCIPRRLRTAHRT
jgi:hypothetical protein